MRRVKRGPIQVICVIATSPLILPMGLMLGLGAGAGWVFEQISLFFGLDEEEEERDDE